ncbi:MAG TPA: tRNA (adenosine(37)-N6)-threonylcarbamoyltransferase complex dimerization subunit type 1 TsaB [Puia sp.]|jgi:tRNA threonylcarbamoyladenosine biosynthesis protein TsaB|nr:tRNA (adenosine(37)-N6)-threonylcarbamoyltransferase complex dimerization subunit type 1 TsaB [Puia sp.]
MSVILNIDTAMGMAGVCISKEGSVLALAESQDQKNHSSWLHPAIGRLLAETHLRPADLQAVAVTAGPGSYTGLRVGMAAAKGFCYALGIPLIAENTLNMMAFAAREQLPEADLLCPMIDARRMEVFTAIYGKEGEVLLSATAMVIDENSFSEFLSVRSMSFFGEGSYKCKQLITASRAAFVNPSYHVGYLGKLSFLRYLQKEFTGVAYSEPVYTKEFHSHTKK